MRALTIKFPSSLASRLTAEFISQSIFNLLIVSRRALFPALLFYLASITRIWAVANIQIFAHRVTYFQGTVVLGIAHTR